MLRKESHPSGEMYYYKQRKRMQLFSLWDLELRGPAKSDGTNKRLSNIGSAFHACPAENIKAVKLYSW